MFPGYFLNEESVEEERRAKLVWNVKGEDGVVRGLAMMTAALERASPTDQPWIRGMQEEAFSLAAEADRRTAIALAQDILGGKGGSSQ